MRFSFSDTQRAAVLRPSALAAMAFFSMAAVQAQTAPEVQLLAQNARLPSLADTVVTATRMQQPLTDVVADVSIVDSEAIERSGATGLVDVLSRLPGVAFVRNGGPATSSSLYLRGAETRYTAVFIDGVRVDSQAGSGGAAWEAIPLSLIDRIEVLRGPAGAVYGSDALGGVVQIFTKKGEAGFAPTVGVGAGSHGTWRAEAGLSGANGTLDYALGVVRETSEGFNAKQGGNPDRDGYRQTAANARVGVQINAAHRLEGTLLANDSNSGYDTSPKADDRSLRRTHALGLNWLAQWSSQYQTRLSITDSRDRYETRPSPYLTDTQVRSYLLQNEWRWGAHVVSANLERREDHLSNDPIDRSRSQNALSLGYGLRAGAHTLQLNVRHDDDSEFGGKATGSAAYGFEFAPHWRAMASVGTAFKAPTLYQRFSMYGDSGLQPENGRNAELGVKWLDGTSSFSATVYRNKVSNLINWVGGPGPCPGGSGPFPGCYDNVGKALYEGVTLAASHRWMGVQWHGSIDWQNPHDLATGKLLARRAKRYATLGAETRWAGWDVGAELQATGQRFDNPANTQVLSGYGVVNLYASTRLARDWLVLARLDNLGDKDYQLARTYNTPGRTLYVGVKWAPR